MSETTLKPRREFRNINIFTDVRTYRMPIAAIVSILHRISGALMFVLLPFVIWLLDKSVSSEISFGQFTAAFSSGLGIFPGWFVKLVTLGLIWAYLHHAITGLRFIYMDVNHAAVSKQFGKTSAVFAVAVSLGLTVVLGAKLFGLY